MQHRLNLINDSNLILKTPDLATVIKCDLVHNWWINAAIYRYQYFALHKYSGLRPLYSSDLLCTEVEKFANLSNSNLGFPREVDIGQASSNCTLNLRLYFDGESIQQMDEVAHMKTNHKHCTVYRK